MYVQQGEMYSKKEPNNKQREIEMVLQVIQNNDDRTHCFITPTANRSEWDKERQLQLVVELALAHSGIATRRW